MESSFSSRVIRAFEAGRAERQADDDRVKQQEDRKLQQDVLKHQLASMKLRDKIESQRGANEAGANLFKLMESLPGKELPGFSASPTPGGTVGESSPPLSFADGGDGIQGLIHQIASRRVPMQSAAIPGVQEPNQVLPHDPVTIPGIEEWGIPAITATPRTRQDTMRDQLNSVIAQKQVESSFAAPTIVPEGAMATGGRLGEDVLVNPKDPPRPTEGEVARGLAAAWFKDKHKLDPKVRLSDTQQAAADAEYDAYKASLRPTDPTLQALRDMQLQILKQQQQEGRLSPAQFTQAQQLSDDFMKNSKDFITRRSAFDSILSASQNPSAAGDLRLIFSFMKMLDPGSTVREGEFANAQNAAGVPDQIRNAYNKARNGERLNPDQRNDFMSQAKLEYENALTQHRRIEDGYKQRAEAQGLPAKAVVLDLTSANYKQANTATMPGGQTLYLHSDGLYHARPE